MKEYIVECSEIKSILGKPIMVPHSIDLITEVVRCKDCIHFNMGCELFEFYFAGMNEMGYCAWGDREGERAGTIQSIQPVTTRWEEVRDE